MNIILRRGWEMPERLATPEHQHVVSLDVCHGFFLPAPGSRPSDLYPPVSWLAPELSML